LLVLFLAFSRSLLATTIVPNISVLATASRRWVASSPIDMKSKVGLFILLTEKNFLRFRDLYTPVSALYTYLGKVGNFCIP